MNGGTIKNLIFGAIAILALVTGAVMFFADGRTEQVADKVSNGGKMTASDAESNEVLSNTRDLAEETGAIDGGDGLNDEGVHTTAPQRTSENRVTAYITSIEGGSITLDHFDLLEGKSAFDAKVTDGECTPEDALGWEQELGSPCFPNGVVYFRNKNTKLRTYKASPNVVVVRTSAFDTSSDGTGVAEVSLDELQRVDRYTELPFRITLDADGVIVRMEELFRP